MKNRDIARAGMPVVAVVLFVLSAGCGPEPGDSPGLVQQAIGPVPMLAAADQPKFVNPLPNPLDPSFVFQPIPEEARPPGVPDDCDDYYEVGMHPVEQSLGLSDPATGAPLTTSVWGYGTGPGFGPSTFPGRTIVARGDAAGVTNRKVCIQWTNDLIDEGGAPLAHLMPIDATLHWAFSLPGYGFDDYLAHGVPVVPHVHGGHTESDSDGLPEYWWTPGESLLGPRFVKSLYEYDNDQQAGTLWYHDHGLGITRLNVYAGLAGFYIVRDDMDTGEADNPLDLPAYPYEVPLVIQDRQFTADGQLFYPTTNEELPPGAPNPSALPEFFGDFILVNGQAWPRLDVEPRKYRLRILNGSDSRFYTLWVDSGSRDGNGPPITVIGTDDGLLYQPAPVDQLVIAPGERYDVVIDFGGWEGERLVLRNRARSPYPFGETVDPRTEGQVMALQVGSDVTVADEPLPATLRPAPIQPADVGPITADTRRRKLLLYEGTDAFGRLQPMLGVAEPTANVEGGMSDGTQLWDEGHYPITENPMLDDVEVWEVYNTTVDAHPIHLHLVSFQILERQRFVATATPTDRIAHDGSTSIGAVLSDIRDFGRARGPSAEEAGWKDTAVMLPGQVTRVVARFDRPGRYVWHCHILSHEDHEMMRPYCVGDYDTYCQ